MTIIDRDRLKKTIGDVIEASLPPSKRVAFLWSEWHGPLVREILLGRNLPHIIYSSNEGSFSFPVELLPVKGHSSNDLKFLTPALVDLSSKEDLIVDCSILNDRLDHPFHYRCRSIRPFAFLYRSEIDELLGLPPSTHQDEFLLREDSRNGIITSKEFPTHHKEWYRYNSDQKQAIAIMWANHQNQIVPIQHELSQRPKDLVR